MLASQNNELVYTQVYRQCANKSDCKLQNCPFSHPPTPLRVPMCNFGNSCQIPGCQLNHPRPGIDKPTTISSKPVRNLQSAQNTNPISTTTSETLVIKSPVPIGSHITRLIIEYPSAETIVKSVDHPIEQQTESSKKKNRRDITKVKCKFGLDCTRSGTTCKRMHPTPVKITAPPKPTEYKPFIFNSRRTSSQPSFNTEDNCVKGGTSPVSVDTTTSDNPVESDDNTN